MALDLVIFDCDGVLVDSEGPANRILAEELRREGLALRDEEVVSTFVGLSLARCVEIVEQRLGRTLAPDFLARLERRTYEAFRRELRPVEGVAEALERIAAPTCVASSGSHDKMRFTLGLTGLLERFEGRLFSASEVARGKPFPDLFLHAAATLGAKPARTLVVEDSRPGVEAARAAGMQVVGYAARGQRAELERAGATVIVSMGQLAALVAALEAR